MNTNEIEIREFEITAKCIKRIFCLRSNLSYDDNFCLKARSENGCGKLHFLVWNRVRIWRTGRHTPTKNFQEYPPPRGGAGGVQRWLHTSDGWTFFWVFVLERWASLIHDIYHDITSYANRSFRHPVPGEKLCRKAGVVVASHAGIFRGTLFSSLPTSPPKNACVGG